jgi:mRNA interferase MazF
VVSLDGLGRLPLRIVVPLTDWRPALGNFSWFVPISANATNGLTKDSGADAFQVKSASDNRFVSRLGAITPSQVADIATAIANSVGAP